MRVDIPFKNGANPVPNQSIYNTFSEWLVELQSLEYPDVKVIEVVIGRSFDEAVYNAFWTRNIASSWKVTEVEECDIIG